MSLVRTRLAPDAQILVDSWNKASDQRTAKELQEKQSASQLAQMLQGQTHQADLAAQAQARQGEESLGALNAFLQGSSPELQDRLGRRTEGPTAEGVAGPGSPVFNPYEAKGAGAPMLAEFVKGEIANASAEGRAAASQGADLRNLFIKQGFEQENLGVKEGGLDRRQSISEGGQDRRLGVREEGLDSRFVLGEQGKSARSTEMAGAIAGESTLRTQMSQIDNYIKSLEQRATAAQLKTFMSGSPQAKQLAEQELSQITAELYRAQEQYRGMLQPRSPGVTQPVTGPPQTGQPVEVWGRGPDGRLIPMR